MRKYLLFLLLFSFSNAFSFFVSKDSVKTIFILENKLTKQHRFVNDSDYVVVQTFWEEKIKGPIHRFDYDKVIIDGKIVPVNRINKIVVKGLLFVIGEKIILLGKDLINSIWAGYFDINAGETVQLSVGMPLELLFSASFVILFFTLIGIGYFLTLFGKSYSTKKWNIKFVD